MRGLLCQPPAKINSPHFQIDSFKSPSEAGRKKKKRKRKRNWDNSTFTDVISPNLRNLLTHRLTNGKFNLHLHTVTLLFSKDLFY